MLSVHPHCISFVCIEHLVFGVEDLSTGVTHVIISEHDIVFAPSKTRSGQGSPQISVHFSAKSISKGGIPLLLNGLVCGLCILTQVADDCRPVIDELDAFNGTALYECMNGAGCNVSQASVQHQ